MAMTVSRATMAFPLAPINLRMGAQFSFRRFPGCLSAPSERQCSINVMLSLEEISDRLEIQQLLVDYSTAIDQRRFDDLDNVFTPDAYIELQAGEGQ